MPNPERKTFLMGVPGTFIEERPEPDLSTDAKPKVGFNEESGYPHPGEYFVRDSGLAVPEPGTLRAWIKFAGEPSEVLFETPEMFTKRWLAFCHDETQEVCYVHNYTDGEAFAIFRSGIPHLWKVGITYQSTPPRAHARSIWEQNCPCPLCNG